MGKYRNVLKAQTDDALRVIAGSEVANRLMDMPLIDEIMSDIEKVGGNALVRADFHDYCMEMKSGDPEFTHCTRADLYRGTYQPVPENYSLWFSHDVKTTASINLHSEELLEELLELMPPDFEKAFEAEYGVELTGDTMQTLLYALYPNTDKKRVDVAGKMLVYGDVPRYQAISHMNGPYDA